MTDRERAYHGHQTESERLDDIRRRLDALRVHAGETDYAHRVIMDCAWLLEHADVLRSQMKQLQALGVSMHKASGDGYRLGLHDGRDIERDAVVAWLQTHWEKVLEQTPRQIAKRIEHGEHRGKS